MANFKAKDADATNQEFAADGAGSAGNPFVPHKIAKQSTHDDLNANANVQVGDADASISNPVPTYLVTGTSELVISDGGNSVTVDGHVSVTGTVTFTNTSINVTDGGGSLTVDGYVTTTGTISSIEGTVTVTDDGSFTVAANDGVDIGDVTINNAGGGSAVNIQDGGNSITVDGTVDLGATDNAVLDQIELNTSYGDNTGGGVEAGSLRVTLANDSTGLLSVDDNGGSLTVDGYVAVTGTVDIGNTVTVSDDGSFTLAANDGVDIGDVTINNAGGGSAVNIQDGGNSITIDGTVDLGATDNAVLDQIEVNTSYGDNTGGGTESGSLRVTLANDSTGLLSVDDNGGSLTVDGYVTSTGTVSIEGVVSVDDNAGSLTVDNSNLDALAFGVQGASSGLSVTHVTGTSVSVVIDGDSVGIGGGVQYTEDAASAGGETGTFILGVRNDAGTTPVTTDGDYHGIQFDNSGRLRVVTQGGAGGTSSVDEAAFTLGSDSGTPAMGYVGEDSLATGSVGVIGITADRLLRTQVENTLTVTDDGSFNVTVDNASIPVTDNGGSLTVDGHVSVTGTIDSIVGTVTVTDDGSFTLAANDGVDIGDVTINNASIPVTDNGGSLTVDGHVSTTGTVTFTNTSIDVTDGGGSLTVDGYVTATGTVFVEKVGSVVNAGNSTTSTLGGGGVFTGTAADLLGYTSIVVTIDTSHDSATDGMSFQFSTDSTNWDDVYLFTYTAANGARRFQFPVTARYFRYVHTNGGTPQTHMRVQTILHTQNIMTSVHRLADNVSADRSANVQKSALIARVNGTGDFIPIQASAGGILKVGGSVDVDDISAGTQTNDVKITMDGEVVSVDDNGGSLTVDGYVNVSGTISSITNTVTVTDDGSFTLAANDGVDIGDVTINNAGGGSAVNIQDGGNSITVDGTVDLGATDNAVLDQIEVNTSYGDNTGGGTEAGSLRVTLANDSTGLLSVDDNGGSLTVDGYVAVTGTVNVSNTVTVSDDGSFTLAANDGVDIGDVTINNAAGGSAVNIQDGGNSITVDGTVTANLSATDNAVLDQIELNTSYGDNVGGGVESGSLRVTIANDSTGLISVDDNGGSLTVDGFVSVSGTVDSIVNTVTVTDDGSFTLAANSGVDVGDVTINNAAGAAAVNIQDGGNVITVDGTVDLGATDNAVLDQIEVNTSYGEVVGGGAEATALRVTIANDSTGVISIDDGGNVITVDGTVDLGATDNAVLDQIEVNTSYGDNVGGGTETGALRVTIANNSTGVLSVDDNNSSLSVDYGGTAPTVSNAALQATGDEAHDAADAGNPVKVGHKAINHGTSPTEVASNDRTDWYANRAGVPWVIGGHPNVVTIRANYTAAQTDTAVVTANANEKIVVTRASVTADAANTVDVQARIGFGAANTPTTTGVILSHPGIAAGSGVVEGSGAGMLGVGAAAEDVRITSEVPTTGSIDVVITYYIVTEA